MTDEQSTRDELRIQRVLADYAWGCDNGDWDLLRSVFTDDVRLDYSSTAGPVGGPDEVVAWLRESLSQLRFIHHAVSNFRVDVAGDEAAGRAMFTTAFGLPGADGVVLTGGYYELELVRTGEGWRIRRLFEDNRWMTRGVHASS